jgi:thiopurine S-methyltransferase
VHPDFWHERWRTGRIGFHQPEVDHNLARHWRAIETSLHAGDRVFVPLCGKSLDLVWLRERGAEVMGVDISDLALQAFCLEQGVPARRRTRQPFEVYEARALELWSGDFFALRPQDLAGVRAVYDRGALVSFAPDLRRGYALHMAGLTEHGTQTLLVALEYPQGEMDGPPFALDDAMIEGLYAAHHRVEVLERRDVLDTDERMRGRGVTALHEVTYRLTRL